MVICVLKEGVILKPSTLILRNKKNVRFLISHLLSDKGFLKKLSQGIYVSTVAGREGCG